MTSRKGIGGRKPNIIVDNKVSRINSKVVQIRQDFRPIYQSQEFKMPEDITDPMAIDKWKWMVEVFKGTRNCPASDADIDWMKIYCNSYADYMKADQKIRELDVTKSFYVPYTTGATDSDGNLVYLLKKNPLYEIRREAFATMQRMAEQLGLNPMARAEHGLKSANAYKPTDDLEAIQNREVDE